ncbi:hypothetical protein RIR_jg22246.t1 [Rhizophagus irregularis DAOM 181602=DAOM 197198]|uniref:Uncharacterized protein n=1 Tax=Rhizophagus irregularis (strain DAOM 181602 / DAOM 197198 / MUCL 43194) TaxID=747089 RepID=U9SR38_RHIID|nr:hypothetical protein RIR_jg22246.t1 [Rhizophagus irregularis DAOM 181602=DAOM 197198]
MLVVYAPNLHYLRLELTAMIQGFIQIGRLPTFNEYRTEPLEPSDSLLTVKLCYRKRPNRSVTIPRPAIPVYQ